MPPEIAYAAELRTALSAVQRKLLTRHVASGGAAAITLAFGVRLVAILVGWGPVATWSVAAAVGALAWIAWVAATRAQRTREAAARALERANPQARNVIITAEEILGSPHKVAQWLSPRIHADAVSAAHAGAQGAVPARPLLAALAIVVIVAVAHAVLPWHSPAEGLAAVIDAARSLGRPDAARLVVLVEPPAYTRQPAVTLTDPDRIDVLAGSRVVLTAAGRAIRFGDGTPSDGRAELVATTSGYVAIEGGDDGRRSLIPLDVRQDRVPLVRIETPAKDLLLPNGSRAIPVTITASDDLGLQSLELRFTKVSGTGEQFEFVEGTLPVRIARESDREWKGTASLDLAPLELAAGDSLIYRATSNDARPGEAGLGSSDTYFVEIAGPGQVALEGIEMPPELERYAMSQQMIVLKIERLRAREPQLPREEVIEETASLAAEQRTVRANFIFLLGGHVEDEEEEAEQSHEIQEGRLENRSRKEINAAISQMTRAEQGLTAVNTGVALPPAKAAVESLQRAFGRSRYLLRSLAVRSRLDPSRRLTGNLADADDWRRTEYPLEQTDAALTAAHVQADLMRLAAGGSASRAVGSGELAAAAERALAVDPTSPLWREVSKDLLELSSSAEDGAVVRSRLEAILRKVAGEVVKDALPRRASGIPPASLRSAFEAEVRR